MAQSNKYTSGQTLFELIVSLGIGILIVTAVVVLVTGSVKNTTFSQNNAMATRYAQEALEWAKGVKEGSWSTLYDKSTAVDGTTYCLQTLVWTNGSPNPNCTPISGTVLERKINVKRLDTDNDDVYETIHVTSTVNWVESGQNHNVTLDTQFTDWRSL